MNSFSHYAFGAVCEWMFRTLAGIESDGPGYEKIIIRPLPPSPGSNAQHKPIDWVNASYDSIRGRIESNWRIVGQASRLPESEDKRGRSSYEFHLNVTIPANTTATVYLPASDPARVTEGGKPLDQINGVRLLKMDGGQAVLAVESGHYEFASRGGIREARVALQTSQPTDPSINPKEIDLTGARRVAHWDFHNSDDVARWTAMHDLKIQRRGDRVFLVATGDDPGMSTILAEPLTGTLAIELRARPTKGTRPQFFWASPAADFNEEQTNSRRLNSTSVVNRYLLRIGDDQPLQKLRFDPFLHQGEMEIESLTIYQLEEK